MADDPLLSLCGGCKPLAAESKFLGVQYASLGLHRFRVVALDAQGPMQLLGPTPAAATPLDPFLDSSSAPQEDIISRSEPLHSIYATYEEISGEKGRKNDTNLTAFFLHGGGGRAGQFRHLLHFLAQRGIRCIAPDLPGHGLSRLQHTRWQQQQGAAAAAAPAAAAAARAPAAAAGERETETSCSVQDTQTIVKAIYDALAGTRSSSSSSSNSSSSSSSSSSSGIGSGRRAVLLCCAAAAFLQTQQQQQPAAAAAGAANNCC
ncbi:hypothetical protein, conserved [Eimeria brunetti]|uniref:AB hydrolase-1 domain-containing protein n=1 Tax=Eimeria brunetti TaxID=51314 RepID=U6LNW6_9EIME|nr:hypothetical protein, conserved [Eimeria brunetti]